LNRTILLRITAVVAAVFAPLAAAGQVNPDEGKSTEQSVSTMKYEAYVGVAYSRIRQVTGSYSGLLGEKGTLTRDWGNYFQLTGSVDYYTIGTGHANVPDPGRPTMYTFMLAPGLHTPVYDKLSAEIFAELGGEHTGGENMTPSISFAGGFGGGLSYNLFRNLAVKLTGDRVGASFSLANNTSQLGYSTHRTWNARGTLGLAYRF